MTTGIPEWFEELKEKAKNEIEPFHGCNPIIPNEILEKDPQLLRRFESYYEKRIKRDSHLWRTIFYTGLSAFCPDYLNKFTPVNVFIKGESSSGKTFNTTEVMAVFPKDSVWMLGGLSPKALIHGYGVLVDKNDEEIYLFDKPSTRKPTKRKSENDEKFNERLKEWETEQLIWKERMKDSKYVIDLNGKILVFLEAPPLETFMMLRPILSHDVPEISYRFVDKTGGGSLQTRNVVIRGWCATIFCTIQCDYLEELSTRSFTTSPSVTTEKIKAGVNAVGEKAAFPEKYTNQQERDLLTSYIEYVSNQKIGQKFYDGTPSYGIINPLAIKLVEYYPTIEPRAMRDTQHLLALTNVSAMLHYAQRPILSIHENNDTINYILVTLRDIENIFEFLPKIGETTVSGLPQENLDVFERVCIPLFEEKGSEGFSRDDVVQKQNEVFPNKKREYSYLVKILKSLTKRGYLTEFTKTEHKNKKFYRVINKPENPFKTSIIKLFESYTKKDFEDWFSVYANEIHKNKKVYIHLDKFHEESSDIDAIYSLYYQLDPTINDNLAHSNLPSSSLNQLIDSYIRTSKSNHKGSKKSFLEKIRFLSGVTTKLRQHDTCYICGDGTETSFSFIDLDKKSHDICEKCAKRIMDEMKRRELDH